MAIELKDLIESIKTEGIRSGEVQASEILKEANNQKELLIKEAQAEADQIIANAKEEAAKEIASGEAAIQQAARNLILNLKKELQKEFSALVEREVSKALDGDLLKEAIIAVVKGICEDKSDLSVLVDAKALPKIEKGLIDAFANEVKAGMEIKPFDQIDAGFRIGMKDGSAFYDFSDKEISLLLSQYLNQKLAMLLTNE